MGKKLTLDQIPQDAPIISTTSSFGDIREGQIFGLVCKRCGKIQYRRFRRKNIAIYNKMLCISCEQSERQTKCIVDKENPVLVTTSDEVASLPLNQPFKFICKRCKKEIVIKCAGERAANRFTGYCVNCYQSVFSPTPLNSYICKRCGKLQHVKEYDPRKIESNKQMICNDCSKFRFTYDNISFDSSWELAIWIYAKDHNIPIEREPVKLSFNFDGKEKHVIPDFRYNGKLIEIKGEHYYDKKTRYCKISV